ncbi:MAG: carbonic anhydrase family protein [Bdellovibrionales bacterium]
MNLLLTSLLIFFCSPLFAKNPAHGTVINPNGQFVDESKVHMPDEALAELIKGNDRFLQKKTLKQDFLSQVKTTSQGQHPYAVILSCLDSRVPPEIVFDQGIGDLFVARVAGNIENQDILGSLEFATQVKGSKLILVLGHTACGAVEGACQDVKMGNLTGLLSEIEPVVKKVGKSHPHLKKNSKEFVEHVSDENVKRTVKDLIRRSDIIQNLVKEGKLKVVGAKYDVATGKVTFFK